MKRVAPTLKSIGDLASAGLIPAADLSRLKQVSARYAVGVTPAMAALIDAGDAADPIARQFIPTLAELEHRADELSDPIGDAAHSPVPGVVHRYPDRALLKLVHACPVYCRFCFRREMVGPGGAALNGTALDAAIAYLASQPGIWEVVMTGGDPFTLSMRRVREITRRLEAIAHLKVIRWHSRVPVVAPERVTVEYARALRAKGKATWIGIHANHPRELTLEARAALARLADAGNVLISQSVLLRGVNDDVETLEALMRAFVENRVKPYYLHHPDMAPGTGHFRLGLAEAQALVKALRGRVSGLCQPVHVLDLPGGHGKVPVGSGLATAPPSPGEPWLFEDRLGVRHAYREDGSPAG